MAPPMNKPLVLALVLVLIPLVAEARGEAGPVSLETGIGFTSDPATFLLATELPIQVARDVELGPLLQLGFGDHELIVAPSLDVRYSFLLSRYVTERSSVWSRLRPIAHGGVGFAYMQRDRVGSNDDLGFLFNLGAGIQYEWTDRLAFGTDMRFNVMPDEVLNDRFFFSWQLAQLRYRF
jgi:hypothetical protein